MRLGRCLRIRVLTVFVVLIGILILRVGLICCGMMIMLVCRLVVLIRSCSRCLVVTCMDSVLRFLRRRVLCDG